MIFLGESGLQSVKMWFEYPRNCPEIRAIFTNRFSRFWRIQDSFQKDFEKLESLGFEFRRNRDMKLTAAPAKLKDKCVCSDKYIRGIKRSKELFSFVGKNPRVSLGKQKQNVVLNFLRKFLVEFFAINRSSQPKQSL